MYVVIYCFPTHGVTWVFICLLGWVFTAWLLAHTHGDNLVRVSGLDVPVPHPRVIMAHAALLLDLATELCNMDDMWGATRANRGGRALTIVEAINRVEIMQKTPPLVRWAARLPSNRLAKQLHDQAFQGE